MCHTEPEYARGYKEDALCREKARNPITWRIPPKALMERPLSMQKERYGPLKSEEPIQ
jgi:hypothetical protein